MPDTDINFNDYDTNDILSGIPGDTGEYEYQGLDPFILVVCSEEEASRRGLAGNKSQYIIFTKLNKATYGRDLLDNEDKTIYGPFDSYDYDRQIMVVRAQVLPDIEPYKASKE